MKRQYDLDVATGVFTSKAENAPTKNYCVKLADLCPELMNFKYCSPKLFSGSGLEISIKLLDSTICTSPLNLVSVFTDDTACGEKSVTLKISNVYMSVIHMMNTANVPL